MIKIWPFSNKDKIKQKQVSITIILKDSQRVTHYALTDDPSAFKSIGEWWASTEEEKFFTYFFSEGDFFSLNRDEIKEMYVNKH